MSDSSNLGPERDAEQTKLKIAVEGCGHGSLDAIYDAVEKACATKSWSLSELDFLIICGDFQAVRNELDLNCMSVPRKYRKLGDFHNYYSGAKMAPVLTLVIGGNHEACNYLYELYHGGWLAPNIYYLGAANVIRYGPCRIAGISGIYNSSDYTKSHGERLPYSKNDIRSIYHVREFDVHRLLQIRSQVNIGVSHDWPEGVELFGDYKSLFARKPHFLASAKSGNLGSKPAAELLNHFRPEYWFSGHMHIKFSATVHHEGNRLEDAIKNLDIADEFRAELPVFLPSKPRDRANVKNLPPRPPDIRNTVTEFLALNKSGPYNDFLELMEVKVCSQTSAGTSYLRKNEKGKFTLQYDDEWLAITRAFTDALRIKNPATFTINGGKSHKSCSLSIPKHRKWVQENIVNKDLLQVPENFTISASVYESPQEVDPEEQPVEYLNTQTRQFYDLLQIPNKFSPASTID